MEAGTIFRWKGSRSDRLQGEGKTRDISLNGIYVFTATCPPVGSIIHVDVVMPRLFDTSTREIKAEMKVLRVEHAVGSERLSGFSAVSKGFKLRVSSDQIRDQVSVTTDLRDRDEQSEKAENAATDSPLTVG